MIVEELGSQFSRLVGPRFGRVVAYALGAWVVIQAVNSALSAAGQIARFLPQVDWPPWLNVLLTGIASGAVLAVLLYFIALVQRALIQNSTPQRLDPKQMEAIGEATGEAVAGVLGPILETIKSLDERVKRLESGREQD